MSPTLFTDWVDPERLLVVEDDAHHRAALVQMLQRVCKTVDVASTAAEAEAHCLEHPPELVVLDLGLPDAAGMTLLRRVRAVTDVPIIVLFEQEADDDKVALLDAGADDFVVRPVREDEFLARVRGQVRRAATSVAARSWAQVSIDGVEIDLVSQRVVRHGEPQRLTPTEWALLRALVLHAGRPLSPKQLWDIVWAREFGDFATHVRVHMTHLRRKIEPDPSSPRLIVTEPGVGYRFVGPSAGKR